MMLELLRHLGALLTILTLGVGPFAVLIALFNRRDRRAARLLAAAAAALPGEIVRSDIAIRTRCVLLGGRDVVIVDMRSCAPRQVWEAMARLRARLPAAVRLRLEAPVDRALRTRLIVERLDARGDVAPTCGLAG